MIIRIKPATLNVMGWTLLFIGLILLLFLSHTLIPVITFLVATISFSTVIIWRFKNRGK